MKKLFVFLLLGVFLLMPMIQAGVTLNLPADNAIITSNVTIFNASATFDGAPTVANMSLWTNETGTWAIKNTTIISKTEETHGFPMADTTGGVTGKSGWKIQVDEVTNLTNVTKHASTTCTKAYVQTAYASGVLGTATFVGEVASFSGGVSLSTATDYWILCDNDGGSYVYQFNGSVTGIPVDSGVINWNKRIDQGGAESTTITNTLTYIGYDNSISSSKWTNVYTAGQDVLWNVEACASNQTCDFATSNYTFSVAFFEVSRTHNTSSFETDSETFSINISNSDIISEAKLVYKGTEYSTTKSGDVFSSTIDIPTGVANNSVRWKFTSNSVTYYSDFSAQNVSETVFTLCNATYTIPFLNISFKDESDLSVINASIPTSTFVYYLGGGATTKTLTFINTSVNFNYEFCASPNRTLTINSLIQYKQGSAYPQRIFSQTGISLTNITTNSTLYLLGVSDGLFVTFQVFGGQSATLEGVSVGGTRTLEGSDQSVAQGTTDAAGTVTFWLNPDFLHRFTYVKSGFETVIESLFPTQTLYTVTMGGGAAAGVNDTAKGIQITILPQGSFLDKNTDYTFTYKINSSLLDLSEFGFELFYNNGTSIHSDSDTTSTGGTLTKSFNTSDETRLLMTYYYITDGNRINGTTFWLINEANNFSIYNFVTRIVTYITADMFGILGDDEGYFAKGLLSIVIIILVTGTISLRYGLSSEAAVTGLLFGVVFMLNLFNLIPTPDFLNFIELGDFLVFVVAIVTVSRILKEERR